jgi:hypothetical protein
MALDVRVQLTLSDNVSSKCRRGPCRPEVHVEDGPAEILGEFQATVCPTCMLT